jgi:formylglycine-generating enzyme required for sulfatase activity
MCTELRLRCSALVALLVTSCSSCSSDDHASGDGGTDTGTDSEIVFGETTPCVNEARPGEVCIPGGNYLMGCVPGDTECEENEKPLVMTTLSPFFMDEKEATIAELIEWMNDIRDDPGIVTDPYFGWTDGTIYNRLWGSAWDIYSTDDYVEYVFKDETGTYYYNTAAENECPNQGGQYAAVGGFTWLGAKMYCEWKGMQLPTEAQWEAAARGQTTNEFPCGSNLDECWYGVYACCYETDLCYDLYSARCHCCAPFDVDDAYTCDSPFGIKGMYGNADEWTADYISMDHSACAVECVDPQPATESPYAGAGHIYKGGSMIGLDQSWLRISIRRDGAESDNGGSMTGVRCVRPDTPFVPPDAGIDAGK